MTSRLSIQVNNDLKMLIHYEMLHNHNYNCLRLNLLHYNYIFLVSLSLEQCFRHRILSSGTLLCLNSGTMISLCQFCKIITYCFQLKKETISSTQMLGICYVSWSQVSVRLISGDSTRPRCPLTRTYSVPRRANHAPMGPFSYWDTASHSLIWLYNACIPRWSCLPCCL